MAYPGTDCNCVQGIEYFIDPRHYIPQWDFTHGDILNLPLWEQEFLEDLRKYQEKLKEEMEVSEDIPDEDVTSKNEGVHLVVMGSALVNDGYAKIHPYSYGTQKVFLDSVDPEWANTEGVVGLLFTNSRVDCSKIRPVFKLGEPVIIPDEVLIPGTLSITAVWLYKNTEGKFDTKLTNAIDYYLTRNGHTHPLDYEEEDSLEKYYDKANKARKIMSTMRYVDDWMREITFTSDLLNYDYALEYFEKQDRPEPNSVAIRRGIPRIGAAGGCSAYRKGNFYGRNFDWYYSNDMSFAVRTIGNDNNGSPHGNIFSSIGVVSSVPGLDRNFIEKFEYNEKLFDIMPFYLRDGINEHGVFANVNVVPTGDKGITTGTTPKVEKRISLCQSMLVRYIIDHFMSAKEALEYIDNYVEVYAPIKRSLELHFIIGDENETYIVEFINNRLTYTKDVPRYIITNFYNHDAMYGAVTGYILPYSVTDYGAGLERFNILVNEYGFVNSVQDAENALAKVAYTKAYDKVRKWGSWRSEFVGDYSSIYPSVGNLTTHMAFNPDYEVRKKFNPVMEASRELFLNRRREETEDDNKTWQTVHSSVYDIASRTLHVAVQENFKTYYAFRIA